MGVYFSESPSRGGGGILRIQMRKVKDFANNASILAIFLLKLCNFSQNFLLIMQFFAYWLCFSSFTENFPYFFAKYPHFGQNFWGSLKILKTTHKTGLRNDKDFSKKYTPMPNYLTRLKASLCGNSISTPYRADIRSSSPSNN